MLACNRPAGRPRTVELFRQRIALHAPHCSPHRPIASPCNADSPPHAHLFSAVMAARRLPPSAAALSCSLVSCTQGAMANSQAFSTRRHADLAAGHGLAACTSPLPRYLAFGPPAAFPAVPRCTTIPPTHYPRACRPRREVAIMSAAMRLAAPSSSAGVSTNSLTRPSCRDGGLAAAR